MRIEADAALRLALDDACKSGGVPGAALAVLADGDIRTAEAGVANVTTGEPLTAATRFPTGSIAKAYTAMLALELAAEGRLSLNDPVRHYLPDLRLGPGSDALADAIIVRHLLANACGLPGFHIPDTGTGDDALARFLTSLETVELVHPPGHRFAYSNPGFNLAGLIVERLRGMTWDAALAEHLLRPLGLHETGSQPDQLGDAPVAAAHVAGPDGAVRAVPWAGPWAGANRGNGPTGASLFATAADLARFAAAHLDARWAAMREPQVAVPGPHAEAWGLGWAVYGWDAGVFGWDGVRGGYRTYLRVLPQHGAAVALLTNANEGRRVYRALLPHLLAERFGVTMAPERPATVEVTENVDTAALQALTGEWACGPVTQTVGLTEDGRQLMLSSPQRLRSGFMTPGTRLLPTAAPNVYVQAPAEVDFPVVSFDGDFASISWFGFCRQS